MSHFGMIPARCGGSTPLQNCVCKLIWNLRILLQRTALITGDCLEQFTQDRD